MKSLYTALTKNLLPDWERKVKFLVLLGGCKLACPISLRCVLSSRLDVILGLRVLSLSC